MKTKTIKATVEITDTYGGEANYSWVRRKEIEAKTPGGLVRAAKKAFGWENTRCRKQDCAETIILRPAGICQMMFIVPNY